MSQARLAAWIDAARKRGFTDQYLKRYLIDKGVDSGSVRDAFQDPILKKELSLNQSISNYGTAYLLAFYFLISTFIIQIIAFVGLAVYVNNPYLIALPVFLTGIMAYDIWQRRVNKLLFVIFLMGPIFIPVMIALPLIQAGSGISNLQMYVLLSIYSLCLGIIISYMFNKLEPDSDRMLSIGIFFSSIIALVFATNGLFIRIMHILFGRLKDIAEIPILGLFNSALLNINVGFSISYLFFIIPFAVLFFCSRERNPTKLLFLAIPAVIFIAASILLDFATNLILSAII